MSAPYGGESSALWDPGTTRVAPLASVKSVSASIELHTVGAWGLAKGISVSSAWTGWARSPGVMLIDDRLERRQPSSSTCSTTGRMAGWTGIASKFGPWIRRL